MTAGQAATVAQNGGVDGFAKRGTDDAAGNAAAQRTNDGARNCAKRRGSRQGSGSEGHPYFGASDGTGQGAGNASGSARDGANSCASLLSRVAVHNAWGLACGAGSGVTGAQRGIG